MSDQHKPFDSPALPAALAVFSLLVLIAQQQPIGDVVHRLILPDNDDSMRLVRVRDLLAGQAWFDTIQHRFQPPSGAAMHWSRLVDAPLSLLILALQPLLGPRGAEGVVAALWPPALFGLFLAIAGLGTARLFGARAGWWAVFVATQMPTASLFTFGRIDHHNIQSVAMLGLALGLAAPAPSWRRPALCGAIAAFSLAVGLETMPLVGLAGLALVLRWVIEGKRASRALAAFGLALAGAAPLFFALQTSPSEWGAAQCDALSPPWLLLAASGAAMAVPALLPVCSTRARRLAAAALVGAIAIGAFGLLFPACLRGPYDGLPDAVRAGWLAFVMEAIPLSRALAVDPAGAVAQSVPLLVAALLAFRAASKAMSSGRRWTFLLLGSFVATGLAVECLQMRGSYLGFSALPILGGWAIERAIRLATGAVGLARPLGRLAVSVLVLGKVAAAPVVLAQRMDPRLPQGIVSTRSVEGCGAASVAALDALPPGLVLAPIDLGADLLLFTRHAIIAAPYHRQVDGILAGIAADAGSEAELRAAAARFEPDYLVLCPAWALQAESGGGSPAAARLVRGETFGWLQPLPNAGGLKTWRITRAGAAGDQPSGP